MVGRKREQQPPLLEIIFLVNLGVIFTKKHEKHRWYRYYFSCRFLAKWPRLAKSIIRRRGGPGSWSQGIETICAASCCAILDPLCATACCTSSAGRLTNRNRLTFFGFASIVHPNPLERYRLHPNNDSRGTFCSLLD